MPASLHRRRFRDPRARVLVERQIRLCVSPASLLEVQFVVGAGRIRLTGTTPGALADDPRWAMDSPSSEDWFRHAWGLS